MNRDPLPVTGDVILSEAKDLSRRDAIKSFSLVGMAAALDVTLPSLERATNAVAALSQQPAYAPKFFTHHEWLTLRMLVDYIIPRDANSGSATDAKVPEFMDFLLADNDAGETTNFGSLAFNSAGAVSISEDSSTTVFGPSTAGGVVCAC